MMTAEQNPPDAYDVLTFRSPERDTTHDRVPFTLDDDPTVLIAVRPKTAILLDIADGMVSDDTARQLRAYMTFQETVLDEPSRKHLNTKMMDPADPTDVESLEPVIQAVMGLWYDRPTGSQGGSRPSPSRTGPRSTGRRRSRG